MLSGLSGLDMDLSPGNLLCYQLVRSADEGRCNTWDRLSTQKSSQANLSFLLRQYPTMITRAQNENGVNGKERYIGHDSRVWMKAETELDVCFLLF